MRVPNQRRIKIHKESTNKTNLYTTNNLMALDEAARRLQTKGGFKLYMYLAKNQDSYVLDLYSSNFLVWSGLGIAAYRTAFNELIDHGYLILKDGSETIYTFYDKAQKECPEEPYDHVKVEFIPDTVENIKKAKEQFEF